ncbi:hypothetical protein Ade02nite_40170 [Paractinoplanes deccanensis]|uniref:DUF4203 domain-containing protein n=1 Tax=Paractinoplanes deccanensis TaxID=113561 RepID=A0ABQ3Y5W4_9ACTN|nr:DUF4203 domain-containing protein [Actinoplanes deccanensis]GID75376.1 hypothetical protein Ade02nite_40170 [Actinoplanes deccanensis]
MDTSGLGALIAGAVLCFAGVRSLNLAVFGSGFAVGWLITEPFGATLLTALIVAVAAAVVALVLARVVFRAALFFVGGLAGAVIGAKVFGLLQPEDGSVVLLVLFVAATGFIGGLVTQRFHATALAVVCALGGAALILSGLARAFPEALGFLRDPGGDWEAVLTTAIWIVLAALGWSVQRGSGRGGLRPAGPQTRPTPQ